MPVLTKNQNRFRKVYPGIRKNAVDQALYPTKVEASSITLSGESTATYTFTYQYSTAPAVMATVYDSTGAGNTTAYISSISTTAVTIETSVDVTGTLYIQVIEITGS